MARPARFETVKPYTLMVKIPPFVFVAVAVVALFGTLWKRRIETARPPDPWEPVSLS